MKKAGKNQVGSYENIPIAALPFHESIVELQAVWDFSLKQFYFHPSNQTRARGGGGDALPDRLMFSPCVFGTERWFHL